MDIEGFQAGAKAFCHQIDQRLKEHNLEQYVTVVKMDNLDNSMDKIKKVNDDLNNESNCRSDVFNCRRGKRKRDSECRSDVLNGRRGKRKRETKKIKSGKNITDSNHSVGITVHRNPHLYLNDDFVDLTKAAATTTKTKIKIRSAPKKEVFQPTTKTKIKIRSAPKKEVFQPTTKTKINIRSAPKKEVFQPLGEFDYKHRE